MTPLFFSKLEPIEVNRIVEADKWMGSQSANDYITHLTAMARFHAEQAIQASLDAGELPNMAGVAKDHFEKAQKYGIALDIFLDQKTKKEPFKILT